MYIYDSLTYAKKEDKGHNEPEPETDAISS